MKNIKFDKKKVASLLLALGIMIIPNLSKADIRSYAGMKAKLTDGREITLYYSNDNNRSFIGLDGKLGFVNNECIEDLIYYDTNDYFSELNSEDYIRVDSAIVYGDPDNKNIIGYLPKDTKVHIYASTTDGYYVVYANNMMGFIEQSSLVEQAYVEPVYEETYDYNDSIETISVTKITGNNINVRSTPRKADNIIGFCDKTDKFVILDHVGGYYEVDYLGKIGYISDKYVQEVEIDKSELEISKMVYLPNGGAFYAEDETVLCYLPAYQNVLVLDEMGSYYKVSIDGVIGYVKKRDTKGLTRRCVVVDTSRQILKVYKNGKEVFRCKVITGAKGRETELGCFKIGHRMEGYTFENSGIYNEYWLQFDGNRGIHPADANAGQGWQKESYFKKAVSDAYDAWSRGRGKTYPSDHGSHGCVNTMINDTRVIYDLVREGDNVLIIEQNDLVRNKLISFNNQDYSYCATNNIDNNYQKTIKLV